MAKRNNNNRLPFPYQQEEQRRKQQAGIDRLKKRHQDNWPYRDDNYDDPYGPRGLTIEEFIDKIQTNLRVSCRLPKVLSEAEIRRIIVDEAMPYFYEEDTYSLQQDYYVVPNESLDKRTNAGVTQVFLPAEVQAVTYVHMIDRYQLFQIGTTPHALSVELGANQAYMPSYLQAIGDFGVYRSTLEGFADMINELFNRYAYKYSYNQRTGQLKILTNVRKDLVLEVFGRIPQENLFSDHAFYQWVTGRAMKQIGLVTDRYEFNLPGGVRINTSSLVSYGEKEMEKAEQRIKERSHVQPYFKMISR